MNEKLPIEFHPLMLDRQMPSWTPGQEHMSDSGQKLQEILPHFLHWVALYLENAAGVVLNVSNIEAQDNRDLNRLDQFLMDVTMRTNTLVWSEEDIARLHQEIVSDDMIVMQFIHKAIQYLTSRWDFEILKTLVVELLTATSRWANTTSTSDSLAQITRCPGWVGVTDARLYVESVYWMIPVVLLEQLDYSQIRRRLVQLDLTTPYQEPPPVQRRNAKKKGVSAS